MDNYRKERLNLTVKSGNKRTNGLVIVQLSGK